MTKIFIHKTKINNSCFIDAYLYKDNLTDVTYRGMAISVEKQDLIDSFIELCNDNNDLHIDIYNFIKNELNTIDNFNNHYKESKTNNIKIKISDIENQIEHIKNISNTNFNYDLNIIVTEFKRLQISYYILDDSLYKEKSKTKVPDILINYFWEAIKNKNFDYLKSLDLFWVNCLRRDIQSNIEDLFGFIYNNGLTITPKGYLFCFRRIVIKNALENQSLFQFIINTWKEYLVCNKNMNQIYVNCNNGEYYTTTESENSLGLLQEMAHDYFTGKFVVPLYTDNHTKKFTYKVGGLYAVEKVDNNPNNTCSYGLHIGSKQYVKNNSWLGEQIVGCIVNPRDIIAVSDNLGKLRVRKMFIACLINDDEIDNFNPTIYHYDYTDNMIADDNEEFIYYKFNENYEEFNEYGQKIKELQTLITDYTTELNRYTKELNISKEQITKLLKYNYDNYN